MAGFQISIRAEARQANEAIRATNKEMRAVESSARMMEKALGGNGQKVEALTVRQKALADELKLQKTITEENRKGYKATIEQLEEYAGKVEKARAALAGAQTEQNRANVSPEASAEKINKLTRELSIVESQYEKVNKRAKGFEQSISASETKEKALGITLQTTNKAIEKQINLTEDATDTSDNFAASTNDVADALAAALAAAGVTKGLAELKNLLLDCVDASNQFETAIAGVRRTVGGSELEIGAISAGIKELSREIPISTTELGKLGENAGQLGIARENVLSFVEVMAKLGTATDMSAEQAADRLAQLANITGLDPSMYERLGSALAALGDDTATTTGRIADMSLRIAAAASLAGMSEQDILALSATVGSLGIEAEAGGSSLSKLISTLQMAVETGDGLADFASVANMSAEEFSRVWGTDAVGALNAFIQGLNDTDRNGKTAIAILDGMGLSEVRLSRTILSMAESGTMLSDIILKSNTAWDENTALAEKAATMYGTAENQTVKLNNAVNELKIAIGDELSPTFTAMTGGLKDLTETARGYVDGNKWLVGTVTALIVGLGTMAGGITALNIATKAATVIQKAFSTTLVGTSAAIGPIGIALGVLAAAITGTVIAMSNMNQAAEERRQAAVDELNGLRQTGEEYANLKKAIDDEGASRSDILNTMEQQNGKYFDELKSIADVNELRRRSIELLEEERKAKARAVVDGTGDAYKEAQDFLSSSYQTETPNTGIRNLVSFEYDSPEEALRDMNAALAELEAEGKKTSAAFEMISNEVERVTEDIEKNKAVIIAYEDALRELYKTSDLTDEALAELAKTFENMPYHKQRDEAAKYGLTVEELAKAVEKWRITEEDAANVNPYKDYIQSAEEAAKAEEEFTKRLNDARGATNDLIGSAATLSAIFKEQEENGKLSAETIMRIADAGFAAALSFDEETGAVKLNAEAYIILAKAKIAERIAENNINRAQIAGGIAKEIEETKKLYTTVRSLADVRAVDAKLMALETGASDERIAMIDAENAALKELAANLDDVVTGDYGGSSGGPGAVKNPALEAWEAAYKERQEVSEKWLDTEKHYNRLTAEDEIAGYKRIEEYLKEYYADVKGLAFAGAEEKLELEKELSGRIIEIQKQRYTAEQKLLGDNLSAFRDEYDRKAEEIAKGISDGEFYGTMDAGGKIASLEKAIALRKEQLAALNTLELAAGEDRLAIIEDINEKIEALQRELYTAEKDAVEERHGDEDYDADLEMRRLERQIKYAEDDAEKYAALAEKKRLIDERLNLELKQLGEKHFNDEEALLKAENELYEDRKDDILSVEKEMHDIRLKMATDAADKFLDAEKDRLSAAQEAEKDAQEERQRAEERALDKRQQAQQKRLDEQREAAKKSYDRERADLKEHYDEIEREIARRDRSKELGELKAEAELYKDSATFEGQEHYKGLLDQIEQLEREGEKEALDTERARLEADIDARANAADDEFDARKEKLDALHSSQKEALSKAQDEQKKALDALHREQEAALQRQYEGLISAGKKLADGTVEVLLNAEGVLAEGITKIFGQFGGGIALIAGRALENAAVVMRGLQMMLPGLNLSFGSTRELQGSAGDITNNSTSRTQTLTVNNNGDNIFHTQTDAQNWLNQMSNSFVAAGLSLGV